MHSFIWVFKTMPKCGKKYDPILRKYLDRQMAGRMNRWTDPIFRSLLGTTLAPIKAENKFVLKVCSKLARDTSVVRFPVCSWICQPQRIVNLLILCRSRTLRIQVIFLEVTSFVYFFCLETIFCLLQGTLHKKWSFPLRISLVNVTKSVVSCIWYVITHI